MSRKRLPVWRILLVMATDLLAIGIGLLLAYWLRFHSTFIVVDKGFEPELYLQILPYAWVIWFIALRFENLYRRRAPVFDMNVVRRIVTGSLLALLMMLAFIFYIKLIGDFSRMVSLLLPVSIILTLTVNRAILHLVFRWMMLREGLGQSRTVIIGTGPIAAHFYQSLLRHPEYGMMPVGLILGEKDHRIDPALGSLPVLGRAAEDIEPIILDNKIDEVILTEPDLDRERVPELLVQCERAMAVFRIIPGTTALLFSGMLVETLDGIPLLGIRETPLQGWNAALKRMFDFSAALAGLLSVSPLIAFFAWRIYRQDGHSPFFKQERIGIDGRRFHIIKLRSMRPDAETYTGPIFADDEDPRCTSLGSFLRRSHLDELPQLLNVLRGEMSLVGPRPERPFFVEQFRDNVPHYMARHKVKSGMTGWAQVNGLCGPHGTISERLQYDLYYIENWTLWLDIKILFLTVFGRIKPGSAMAD